MIDILDLNDSFFALKSYIIENDLGVASLIGITIYILGYFYLISKYFDYKLRLDAQQQKKHDNIFVVLFFITMTGLLVALKGFAIVVIYVLLIAFYKLIYTNKRYENLRNRFEDLF